MKSTLWTGVPGRLGTSPMGVVACELGAGVVCRGFQAAQSFCDGVKNQDD